MQRVSIWEAPIHPMDSYAWKDLGKTRRYIVVHMYQDTIHT